MLEIGTSGLMSGEVKRSDAERPKPPRPSSTLQLKLFRWNFLDGFIDVCQHGIAIRYQKAKEILKNAWHLIVWHQPDAYFR